MSQDAADFLMFTLVVSIILLVIAGVGAALAWVFVASEFPFWLAAIIAVVSASAIISAVSVWGS